MSDPFLALSDEIERVLDKAQEAHLNGCPAEAKSRARSAIDLLSRLEDMERRATMGTSNNALSRDLRGPGALPPVADPEGSWGFCTRQDHRWCAHPPGWHPGERQQGGSEQQSQPTTGE